MSAHPQPSKLPAAKPTPERRGHGRRCIVNEQIVPVSLGSDNGGLVLDLGENGMAVQAIAPLPQGKTVEVKFMLPESRVGIHAHGEVRWAEVSGRAGIRLLAFSEGSAADIRSALLQPAAAPEPAAQPEPLLDIAAGLTAPAGAAPATPPPAPKPEVPAPPLDPSSLEREIKSQSLGRELALAYIAERTREAVSASGVAIALGSAEQMTCRASAGAAPAVGVCLQSDTGLSGECVRTGLVVCCDNTQVDARVDAEVCRQLNLRSAVLVPILESGEIRGVLEVFSSRPYAFARGDIQRFEQAAGLVAKIAGEPRAAHAAAAPAPRAAASVAPVSPPIGPAPRAAAAAPPPTPKPIAPAPPASAAPVVAPAPEPAPRASALPARVVPAIIEPEAPAAVVGPVTPVVVPGFKLRAAIRLPSWMVAGLRRPAAKYSLVAGGVMALALAGWGLLHRSHAGSPSAVVTAATPTLAAAPVATSALPAPVQPGLSDAKGEAAKPSKGQPTEWAPKEIKSPAAAQPTIVASEELAIRQPSSVGTPSAPSSEAVAPPMITLANGHLPDLAAPNPSPLHAPQVPGSTVVAGRLVHRVEPLYPDKARYSHIGGQVVLNAVILPNGKVGSMKVVSGHPLLARSAMDAVRAWRYEPFLLNGAPVQGEVTIRLDFNPRR